VFKVILDTNIIISAAHNPAGKPALVLAIALSQKPELVSMYISQEVWAEYQEVITRDKFKYFNQRHVKALLSQIKKHAKMLKPSVPIIAIKIDPADNRILECALAAVADYLITGNIKHFPFKKFQSTRIVSPQEFLVILGEAVFS
jgi:putative PIN family toxin of toxin-antitoxin system